MIVVTEDGLVLEVWYLLMLFYNSIGAYEVLYPHSLVPSFTYSSSKMGFASQKKLSK